MTTPLYEASRIGHVEAMSLLINLGADVNKHREDYTDDNGTPLCAAFYSKNEEAVLLLIEAEAETENQKYVSRETPIHLAVANGFIRVAEILLKRGVDINNINYYSNTPLRLALYSGGIEMIKFVLENDGNKYINTDVSSGRNDMEIAAKTNNVDIVRLMLDHGANPDSNRYQLDSTALCIACKNGNIEMAVLLIERGADVKYGNKKHCGTPLHGACDAGDMELVKLLLDHGADVNAETYHGKTPLHCACKNGNIEMVELLLDQGAVIDEVHIGSHLSCHDALSEAVDNGHEQLAEFLRSKCDKFMPHGDYVWDPRMKQHTLKRYLTK